MCGGRGDHCVCVCAFEMKGNASFLVVWCCALRGVVGLSVGVVCAQLESCVYSLCLAYVRVYVYMYDVCIHCPHSYIYVIALMPKTRLCLDTHTGYAHIIHACIVL